MKFLSFHMYVIKKLECNKHMRILKYFWKSEIKITIVYTRESILTEYLPGLSSLGLGVPWHILTDQLTLSQPRGADYAHQMILAPPDFLTFRRPCYLAKFKDMCFRTLHVFFGGLCSFLYVGNKNS